MRKVAVAAGILGLLIAVGAIVIGSLLWSARRKLDERAVWVEEELRRRSFQASLRTDLDWPPYREFLARLQADSWQVRAHFPFFPSNDQVREILSWQAGGCVMTSWKAIDHLGFDNETWPYIFGVTERADLPRFLQGAPLAQDFFQGGGFAGSLFRASAERRLYSGWRLMLERDLATPDVLASCIDLFDRLEAARPPLKDEIEVEHLLRCREILEIHRSREDPKKLLETQQPGFRSLWSRSMLFSQLLARLDDRRADAVHLADLPPDELWERPAGTGPPPEIPKAWAAVDRSVFRFEAQSALRRRLLRTSLAVARYAAATGSLPERLDQLVPKHLPSIPRCPLTLAPLSYSSGIVSASVEDPLSVWTVLSPRVEPTEN